MARNNRFAGLTLSNVPALPGLAPQVQAPAVEAPAPVVVAPPAPIVGKTILTGAKAVAEREQALAAKVMGSPLAGKQLFATGTKMMDAGEEKAIQYRKEWEALPTVAEACDSLIATIKAEDRLDYSKVNLNTLHVDRFGVVQGINGGVLLNENAWGQIVSNYSDPKVPTRLRSNLNLWLGSSDKSVTFRTRNPKDGLREGFAVVSNRYQAFDLDTIARVVSDVMPQDAHAEVTYDAPNALGAIEVSLSPTYNVEAGELGVGRLHRVIISISSGDAASTGAKGTAKIKISRIACINCTLVADERFMFERKHSAKGFGDLFREALSKSGEALEVFAGLWREANVTAMLDKASGDPLTTRETFERLVAHGYVHVANVEKRDLVDRLMRAWEAEPGKGAAHINMAITRMAHEGNKWGSVWAMDDLETQAGVLLFQRVHALAPIPTEMREQFAA